MLLISIAGLLLVAAEMAAFWLVRSFVRLLRPPRRITGERDAAHRRVLVLTAPVGEGHVAAARAIVAELEDEGGELEVVLVDALEGSGRVLRFILCDLYRWQFGHASRVYGLLYRLLARSSFCRGIGQVALVSFGSRPLLRMVERVDPDIIVSTHPPVTCVLGQLRRRDRIREPVVATITDLDGLCFWVHPGIDLHLVMHDSCIAQVERLAGPGSALCARPLLGPAFREPRTRAQARRALGLPQDGAIAVVSGGGWGVGELEEAARAALEIEDLSVICLAGRSESARRLLELTDRERNLIEQLETTNERVYRGWLLYDQLSLDPPRSWAGSVRCLTKNDLLSWAFPGCMGSRGPASGGHLDGAR